ncbi:hypothetical protein CTI12_AA364730 [Artemisia annua]|uniref:Uncharacterized protein n=1 Tax=Artemisia annua TaxID=35608 RepID=A0A2U1MKZ9_ARTAN|nr:hypothetical protein CTI12_AA364730 [Artemisia annua]
MMMAGGDVNKNDLNRNAGNALLYECVETICLHAKMGGLDFVYLIVTKEKTVDIETSPATIDHRNMLHGPWKGATSPVLTLHVGDNNVNREAIGIALAYLYGNHPKLEDSSSKGKRSQQALNERDLVPVAQSGKVIGKSVQFLSMPTLWTFQEFEEKLTLMNLH